VHETLAEIYAACEEIDSEVAGIKREVLLLEKLIDAKTSTINLPPSSRPSSLGGSCTSSDSPTDVFPSAHDVAKQTV